MRRRRPPLFCVLFGGVFATVVRQAPSGAVNDRKRPRRLGLRGRRRSGDRSFRGFLERPYRDGGLLLGHQHGQRE